MAKLWHFLRRWRLARHKAWLQRTVVVQKPDPPPTPGAGLGRGSGRVPDAHPWSGYGPGAAIVLAVLLLASPAHAQWNGRDATSPSQQVGGGGGSSWQNYQAQNRNPVSYRDPVARALDAISGWGSSLLDTVFSSSYDEDHGAVVDGMEPDSRGSGVEW